MKTLHFAGGLALALAASLPAAADGRTPGSVLVYPVHRSGPGALTLVAVTNTSTLPITPTSFGGSTYAHFDYVNVVPSQVDAFKPATCFVTNATEFLTPADTLVMNTACHTGMGPTEGYLVITAQDPSQFDVNWSFNYLIGSELVLAPGGALYGINAIPFDAIPNERRPSAGQDGKVDFDGKEYEAIPDYLFADSFTAQGYSPELGAIGTELCLINLTGGLNDVNTVQFSIWNDNEYPLSSTLEFSCWFCQPLNAISPLFNASYLYSQTPHDPAEAMYFCGNGDEEGKSNGSMYETGWFRVDSLTVKTAWGFPVAGDGAMLGALTSNSTPDIDQGRLLWESNAKQTNGKFFNP